LLFDLDYHFELGFEGKELRVEEQRSDPIIVFFVDFCKLQGSGDGFLPFSGSV
jgi:hypothetical protein